MESEGMREGAGNRAVSAATHLSYASPRGDLRGRVQDPRTPTGQRGPELGGQAEGDQTRTQRRPLLAQ